MDQIIAIKSNEEFRKALYWYLHRNTICSFVKKIERYNPINCALEQGIHVRLSSICITIDDCKIEFQQEIDYIISVSTQEIHRSLIHRSNHQFKPNSYVDFLSGGIASDLKLLYDIVAKKYNTIDKDAEKLNPSCNYLTENGVAKILCDKYPTMDFRKTFIEILIICYVLYYECNLPALKITNRTFDEGIFMFDIACTYKNPGFLFKSTLCKKLIQLHEICGKNYLRINRSNFANIVKNRYDNVDMIDIKVNNVLAVRKLFELLKYDLPNKYIMVNKLGINNRWEKRNFDNVYLSRHVHEELLHNLDRFYDKNNINNQLTRKLYILLHGPPGTGKLSTVYAITNYICNYVHIMQPNYLEQRDKRHNIRRILNNLMSGLVCMTNIERLDESISNELRKYFDVLIPNKIVICTSHDITKVNPGLLRTFDLILKIDLADHYQIRRITEKLLKRDVPDDILNKIPECTYSTTDILNHLKNYILRPTVSTKDIFKKYEI